MPYTWRETIGTQVNRIRRHFYADLILWAQERGAAVPWNGDDTLRKMVEQYEREHAELLLEYEEHKHMRAG